MSKLWPMTLLLVLLAADAPPFKITTKRDNDRVTVKVEKDRTIFAVESPFGISQATIERTDEKWPESIVLQLRLKGLESFSVDTGKGKLQGSAGLTSGKPSVRLWKNGQENKPLDAKSPYWTEIRILDREGQLAKEIPLRDGRFELHLPAALFEDNPRSITVNWIDFYRN